MKKNILLFLTFLCIGQLEAYYLNQLTLAGSCSTLTYDIYSSYKHFTGKSQTTKTNKNKQKNKDSFSAHYYKKLKSGKQKLSLASMSGIIGSLVWLNYKSTNSSNQNKPETVSKSPNKPNVTSKNLNNQKKSTKKLSAIEIPSSEKWTRLPLEEKYMPSKIPTEKELIESKEKLGDLYWHEIDNVDLDLSIDAYKIELYRIYEILNKIQIPKNVTSIKLNVLKQSETQCGLHAVFNALLFATNASHDQFLDKKLFTSFKEKSLLIIKQAIDLNKVYVEQEDRETMYKGNWLINDFFELIYFNEEICNLFNTTPQRIDNLHILDINHKNYLFTKNNVDLSTREYNEKIFQNKKTIIIFQSKNHFSTFCCKRNAEASLSIHEADSLYETSFKNFWRMLKDVTYSEFYEEKKMIIELLKILIDESSSL
ncbi:hypothetical protein COB28_01575 [Candidatus Dependentiae bacterium]|nr:MAG: hypothetical protein COB28_01575 [Candidatus Dependentiae bacterium]